MTRMEMKVIFVCLILLKLSLGTSVVSVRLPYVHFQNPAGVTYIEGKAPAELVAGPNRHSARIQDASQQQSTPTFTSPTASAHFVRSQDSSSHQVDIGHGQPLNTSPVPRYFLRSHSIGPIQNSNTRNFERYVTTYQVSPTPLTVSHISTIAPGGIAYSTQGNRANYVYTATVPTVQKSAALVVSPAISTPAPVTAVHQQQVLLSQPLARTVVVPSVPVASVHMPVTQIQEHHGNVQKTVNVAQPAVKTRTYEVRRPAIQKQFYDIEERIIVRPAGSVVLELDQPISKVAKGEVVNAVGESHIGQPGLVLTGSHAHQQLDGSLNHGQIDYQPSHDEQHQQQSAAEGIQGNYGNINFGVPGVVYADLNQSTQHATAANFVTTTPAPHEDDTIIVDARSNPAEGKENLQNIDKNQENDQQHIIISTTPQYNEHVTSLQRQAIQLPPPSGNQHQLAQINEHLARSQEQGFVPQQQQQQQHHLQQQQQQQQHHLQQQQQLQQHHLQYQQQQLHLQRQQQQQPVQYTEQSFIHQEEHRQHHEQQPAQYTEQAFVHQQQQPQQHQPVQYTEKSVGIQQQTDAVHGQEPHPSARAFLHQQQQSQQHQPAHHTGYTVGIQQQTDGGHGQQPHPLARASIHVQSANSSPLMITVGDPDFRYPPYSESKTNGISAEQVQINLNSQSGHQNAYTAHEQQQPQLSETAQYSGNYETSPALSPYQSTENQKKFLNLILAQGGVSEYGTHSDLKSDYLRSRVIAATPAPKDAAPTEERVHTRRIVISQPFETVQEVQEQEPFTKIQQVTVNHPTVYKTASVGLKPVQTSVPVYAKQVSPVVHAVSAPAFYQSNPVVQPVALSYQNVVH